MADHGVMDGDGIRRSLTRISHEVVERNRGSKDLVIVGIRRRGVPLAERIRRQIVEIEGLTPPVGMLDIGLYRDDWHQRPFTPIQTTQIPTGSLDGKVVVLVDDVLFTGRTVRAALDALSDFGRPARIQLAVLVDRGHRELPIRADYVGKNIPTGLNDRVTVRVVEIDGEDKVVIESPEEEDHH